MCTVQGKDTVYRGLKALFTGSGVAEVNGLVLFTNGSIYSNWHTVDAQGRERKKYLLLLMCSDMWRGRVYEFKGTRASHGLWEEGKNTHIYKQ
jgi:hypothetical protein